MNCATTNKSRCAAFCRRKATAALGVILLAYVTGLAWHVTYRHDGNVTGLFCISDEYTPPPQLDGQDLKVFHNWIGYDGQFFLWLSVDPLVRDVWLTNAFHTAEHTSYRTQRIVLPLLAHAVALGKPAALPYALLGINLGALLVGCWFFLKLLEHYDASPWWVFAYAFAPVMMIAEFRVLSEALASSLVVIAIWALLKDRWPIAVAALCVAVLTRETTALFSVSIAAWAFLRREPGKAAAFLAPLAIYWVWSAYVYARLGVWPFKGGVDPNFSFPFAGIIEKFTWVLGKMVEIHLQQGNSMPSIFAATFVESLLVLGLVFSIGLAVVRLRSAPRDWLTIAWCAYAFLGAVLSALPWSRFWHSARILDPLVLFPLLVYLQNGDRRFLVPLVCTAPVSLTVLLM